MNLVQVMQSALENAEKAYKFSPNSHTYQVVADVLAIERHLKTVIGPTKQSQARDEETAKRQAAIKWHGKER